MRKKPKSWRDPFVPWAAVFEPPTLGPEYLPALLSCLIACNLQFLRSHPDTPELYQAGVRYRREPPGVERWRAIPWVLKFHNGDCEDLVSWRVAELLNKGEQAEATFTYKDSSRGRLFHILVKRPWGIEDPSRKLGM